MHDGKENVFDFFLLFLEYILVLYVAHHVRYLSEFHCNFRNLLRHLYA